MKKAIGAFFTGLLLSGVVAAVYEVFFRQTSGGAQADQEQATQRDTRRNKERTQAVRPRREHRARRARGGLIDLNGCSLQELARLEGLDEESAGRVIENRPYRNKLDLVSRMVVPEATYIQFSHFVAVSGPDEPVKVAS